MLFEKSQLHLLINRKVFYNQKFHDLRVEILGEKQIRKIFP